MIRVVLPAHLRALARVSDEVTVETDGVATLRTAVEALEIRFPVLAGTIRDRTSKVRRPFIRYFACQRDLSHVSIDDPLPDPVASGTEPLLIVGAMAGG
ncbi:MAG TPA: MoaD/ThiS family protein [Candidatus Aquilonibacter sp.]